MSVIFKEKNYDQLLILFNNLLILILVVIILVTVFNYINKNNVKNLQNKLIELNDEELKYISLLKDLSDTKDNNQENKKYELLISLADYAEQIKYKSLLFKNNKLNLKAESSQQNNIFDLIKALENDSKFDQVNLININQSEDYSFELETLIIQ